LNEAKRPVNWAVCSLIIVILMLPAAMARGGSLDGELSGRMATAAPSDEFSIIVRMKDSTSPPLSQTLPAAEGRISRQERVIRDLVARGSVARQALKRSLEPGERAGKIRWVRELWILNGFALEATADVIRELAARNDVATVTTDRVFSIEPSAAVPAASPGWNLDLIGAPILWSQGFRGQGVVVGSLDTGVDRAHPALSRKWRGGTNSWFDPYLHSAVPYDSDGHGTGTMGIIVGGDTTDNPVGVAPAAIWIAAKIFDDTRHATYSAIHAAFQWMLDPDGDPTTADAPDVVNNSWDLGNTGQYDGEFAPDIAALKSAGIAVVFSAGNGGIPAQPAGNTSMSPGNNPGALPVGVTDWNDQAADFSSRGPSAFDGTSIYPVLAAPGVAIRTTGLSGTYTTFTNNGTSFAAPHVAGAIALLLSGRPSQLAGNPTAVEVALTSAARDLGVAGPDNTFGYGRLDAAQAVLQAGLTQPDPPNGDANGDGTVDVADALLVLQTGIGLLPATPLMMQLGDVAPFFGGPRPDGVIDGRDALVILQKAVGVVNF
jgi:subtilisin family serine protease